MTPEEHVPLAELTTLHVGGNARFFVRVRTVQELREALLFARSHALPLFILGGGSNILVSDNGFPGLVIKIEMQGIALERSGSQTLLIAYAGEEWDRVVARSVEENLWGVENLSGIPGTVGGAPIQNIGAYGVDLSGVLLWVETIDTKGGVLKTFSSSECDFSYRSSVFKKNPGTFIVVRIALRLFPTAAPNLSYRDLAEAFLGREHAPTLQEIRGTVIAIRSRKFPDLVVEGSAGSFFLNPILSQESFQSLQSLLPEVPNFKTPEGIKISLAYLLDRGLHLKGFRIGGARLFEKQPLVVVTELGTSAEDVRALFSEVQRKVVEAYGIMIEPEVQMIS